MQITNNRIKLILKKFNEGKIQEALNEIEIYLINNQKEIEALYVAGIMNSQINKSSKSIMFYEKILLVDPNNTLALKHLYTTYLKINDLDKTIVIINRLLKLTPNHYEGIRDKAYIYFLNKDYSMAEKFIKKAIKLNSIEVFGLNILGLILLEKGETNDAISIFKKAISINKTYFDSFNNLGKCYFDNEDLNLAYKYYKKAYKINPKSDLPLINIANILSLKDKNKTAINLYNKALAINPNNILVYENIAISYCRLKNLEQAMKYYNKAIRSNPNNHALHLIYSYLLIYKKNYKTAWDFFESRLETKSIKKKNIYHDNIINKMDTKTPLNKNERVLIIKEQGVGDEILFASMYNDIIHKCNNVSIEADTRLIKIFEKSFKKNIFFPYGYFSSSKHKINKFNRVLYAGTLTKFFRTNKNSFNNTAYLKNNVKDNFDIKNKLNKLKSIKKIGLSWKSIVNIYGQLKSLGIEDFIPLFKKDRTIVNLQYGNISEEIESLNKLGLKIYSFNNINLFNDFESVISILNNLDIFITVSNSTAHIAGAIGIPTIVICPKKSSTFYYWDYDDGRTPWYNNVRILKIDKSIKKTIEQINLLIDDML